MTSALFPYQAAGRDFLAARRFAYLADEMRLGKSAQAIAALDAIGAQTATVLCPAVARVNWAREFERFQRIPRKVEAMLPGGLDDGTADVQVWSYDMAARQRPPARSVLIVDEAHYLKSTDAGRSASVLGKEGLVHQVERAWFLSGTPAPNNPAEMWTILYVSGVTKLSYDAFVERYCITRPSPYGVRITGGRNIAELRALFDGFLLRRTKAQVRPDMPPVLFSELVVEPGPVDIEVEFFPQWHAGGGDQAVLDVVRKQEALVSANLATLEAIAASAPMYRRYVGLQKVKPVAELVTAELTADPEAKIVLFAIHRGVVEGLRDALKPFGPVVVYGGTDPKRRQRNIDNFQRSPTCRVFIGNVLAAGTAISLDAANQGLIVEADWVPGNNAQAAMRMDGPGQKKQITVQFVATANPMDEAIQRSLRSKAQTLSELFL